jgi:hypothetical protein
MTVRITQELITISLPKVPDVQSKEIAIAIDNDFIEDVSSGYRLHDQRPSQEEEEDEEYGETKKKKGDNKKETKRRRKCRMFSDDHGDSTSPGYRSTLRDPAALEDARRAAFEHFFAVERTLNDKSKQLGSDFAVYYRAHMVAYIFVIAADLSARNLQPVLDSLSDLFPLQPQLSEAATLSACRKQYYRFFERHAGDPSIVMPRLHLPRTRHNSTSKYFSSYEDMM